MMCICCGKEFDAVPLEIPAAHRLLVGDSGKAANVDQVMAGHHADLCFTSPPYDQQRAYTQEVDDWLGLMQGVFAQLPMAPDGQVLVNLGLVHRDSEWVPYWDPWIEWMREQGWLRFGFYVWDKMSALPGDWVGRLAPSHEFVFHFCKHKRKPNHCVPKQETSIKMGSGRTLRHKDGLARATFSPEASLNTHKIPDSVLRAPAARTAGKVEVAHPAVYSVELCETPLLAFTQPGDIVFEPFLGSGTLVVAAEQHGRLCYGIELAPEYAAVALERLAESGLHPHLE